MSGRTRFTAPHTALFIKALDCSRLVGMGLREPSDNALNRASS